MTARDLSRSGHRVALALVAAALAPAAGFATDAATWAGPLAVPLSWLAVLLWVTVAALVALAIAP